MLVILYLILFILREADRLIERHDQFLMFCLLAWVVITYKS